MRRAIAILVAAVALGAAGGAQAKNQHLDRGIKLLNDMEDAKALEELQQALAQPGNTPAEQVKIHIYLGITYFSLLKNEEAKKSFERALELDVTAELPESTSPKIRDFFAKLKEERKRAASGVGQRPATRPSEPVGPVTPPPPPPPRRSINWPAWIAAGVAVAAGAAGLALGLTSRSSADRAADLSLPWAEAEAEHDAARGRALGANICFGVAGAAAVTSTVLFIVGSRRGERPVASVVPLPAGAVVSVGNIRW
jgi:tetratricopeptide (TPR) repeat protein